MEPCLAFARIDPAATSMWDVERLCSKERNHEGDHNFVGYYGELHLEGAQEVTGTSTNNVDSGVFEEARSEASS